ncbi:hypothetical protein Tco_0424252 [Tanacetum coccineum]
MARETNKLCGEVATLVEERSLFLGELDSLPRRRVPDKMAEFLRETQRKDTDRMLQLKILGREIELRARKKEHFIQKLKAKSEHERSITLSSDVVKKMNCTLALPSITIALKLNFCFPGTKHLLLAPSEFIENPAQESKAPLTLSWKRIPRLDSGVRASDPSRWMSFAKRPGKDTPQCYVKPLDSLNNWNNRFFWVDERVFPTLVAWRSSAPMKDLNLVQIKNPRYPKVKVDMHLELLHEVALGSQLRLRFEQESKLLKKSVAKIGRREQKIQVQDDKIKNLESLIEAESDMKRAAEAKNETLTKELEDLRAHFSSSNWIIKAVNTARPRPYQASQQAKRK